MKCLFNEHIKIAVGPRAQTKPVNLIFTIGKKFIYFLRKLQSVRKEGTQLPVAGKSE